MSRNTQDLLNVGFYLMAVSLLCTALAAGATLAVRAAPDAFAARIGPMFETERAPTRLSVATETARQIRAALNAPVPPLAPLPPITAKLAFGHLKDGKHSASRTAKRKLPAEALDAMASAGPTASDGLALGRSPTTWTGSAAIPLIDKHRVY
jgi:hypothetical protein